MNTTRRTPTRLDVVATLAGLLERLEHSTVAVDAAQYQLVARQLAAEFERVPTDAALNHLLDTHPVAAEVYENVSYAQAGLCRAPLERSLNSELEARRALDRAAAKAR